MYSHYQLVGTPEAVFNRKPSGLTLPFLLSKWPLALTQASEEGLDVLGSGLCVCGGVRRGRRRREGKIEINFLIPLAIGNAFSEGNAAAFLPFGLFLGISHPMWFIVFLRNSLTIFISSIVIINTTSSNSPLEVHFGMRCRSAWGLPLITGGP